LTKLIHPLFSGRKGNDSEIEKTSFENYAG